MRLSPVLTLLAAALLPLPALAAVTLSDDSTAYTLANDHVTAKISKRSGDLMSLRFKDLELMGSASGHPAGYWSHSPTAGKPVASITIDPKTNNGQRAEISIKGISGGAPMGQGPGGSTIADIEIRYALGANDHGEVIVRALRTLARL